MHVIVLYFPTALAHTKGKPCFGYGYGCVYCYGIVFVSKPSFYNFPLVSFLIKSHFLLKGIMRQKKHKGQSAAQYILNVY